jgi:hypothetical protein
MAVIRCVVFLTTALVLFGQADPTTLLMQARAKILDAVVRLPKYTCLETIDRSYYYGARERAGIGAPLNPPSDSCPVGFRMGEGNFVLDSSDRMRVEVAIAGKEEMHSWPAASRFDTRTIDQMIPVGPTSTGAFGGSLVDIFNNAGTRFIYAGRISNGRQEVYEYTFRVPLASSHYAVNVPGGHKETGYQGTFQIDVKTAELMKIVEETDDLPAEASMCRVKTSTDYQFTHVGDGQILLPLQSVLETQRGKANRTSSVTRFSACHEYLAESTIRFGDEDVGAKATAGGPKTAAPLPAGVVLTLALTEAVDTRSAAGGDPVSAKVVRAVREAGSNTILVPAGAIAHGRILQMRRLYRASEFMISIRFDSLESSGVVSPLSVRSTGRAVRLGPVGSDEAGSWFSFPSKGEYVMKAGFESSWVTVQ